MSTVVLLGGIPSHKDLAPSVIFIILYVLATPLYVWRQLRPHSRSIALIRPGIFIVARLVVFVVRAVMSKGNASEGLYIAELILLTVGFVFLIDPLISAWGSLVFPVTAAAAAAAEGDDGRASKRSWLRTTELILHLGTFAIIGTGIVIGTKSSDAIDDTTGDAAQTVKTLRKVNYIVSIVLVLVVALGTAAALVLHRSVVPVRKAAHVVGTAALLLVPCIYKIAQNEMTNGAAWVHSTSAFFVLLVTFEYLGLLSLLAVPWAEWYPSQKAQKRTLEQEHVDTTHMVERVANNKAYGQV